MKRLLGLLLVMVGCGGGDEDPPAGETALPATPENAQAKVDDTPAQADDVDPVVSLKELGAQIERNEQGEVVRVNLFGTKITDAGMADLKGLTNLKTLRLALTQITDAGLVHLKGLTNLESLSLFGTQVTDAGIAELQKALPNCQIQKPNGRINK